MMSFANALNAKGEFLDLIQNDTEIIEIIK